MGSVAAPVHVTLSGDRVGRYLIEEERPDGRLLLVPEETHPVGSWATIRDPAARDLTPQEWDAFIAEHGPHMLPPDDEG